MPQLATGPSFMVRPKNGRMASQAISKFEPSLRLTIALAMLAVLALQRRDLTEHEVDLAFADQRHHLVDAVGRGAEIVAPVQQRQVAGDRLRD